MTRNDQIAIEERRVYILKKGVERLQILLARAETRLNRLKFDGEYVPETEEIRAYGEGEMRISQGF